jgi:hypothetical protein
MTIAYIVLWANILLSVICGVWVLMIITAFSSALETSPKWIIIRLKEPYASQIMRKLSLHLLGFIVATAGLISGIYYSFYSIDKYESIATTLLCEVRGTSTPKIIIDGISLLSGIEGNYKTTLYNYDNFLKNYSKPNLQIIIDNMPLPEDRSIYDLRLLGIVYDTLSIAAHEEKNEILEGEYLEKAKKYYDATFKIAFGFTSEQISTMDSVTFSKLPGNPSNKAASSFRSALRSNMAGISYALAMLESDQSKRENLLKCARDEYERIRIESGVRPGMYYNLAAIYAQLSNIKDENHIPMNERARQIIASAQADNSLEANDKKFLRNALLDEKNKYELKPLIDYTEKTKHENWGEFIRRTFE